MKREWVAHCMSLAGRKAEFYSGCRKIHRGVTLDFSDALDHDLKLSDCGFTSNKMRYLERNYLHPESLSVAVELWKRRCEQAKYGSVGLTCYNHFIKNDPNKKSKRASVMGPCIQAVTVTWLTKKHVSVDAFYRTTELFKKFPADLVFIRDVILPAFNLNDFDVELNCHFANVTIHPMYFVTIVPLLADPVGELKKLRDKDKYFYDWVVKWTARYVCPQHQRGIAKFAQALRVQKDAQERIKPARMTQLQHYLIENHPGHRNDYNEEESDE